jgi:hypothetical protein
MPEHFEGRPQESGEFEIKILRRTIDLARDRCKKKLAVISKKQTHEIDHLEIPLAIAQARHARSDASLCEVLCAWNRKASIDLDRAAPESKSSV